MLCSGHYPPGDDPIYWRQTLVELIYICLYRYRCRYRYRLIDIHDVYLSKISSHLMLSPKFIIISQLTQNVSEVFINRKPNQCWVQLGKWLDPEIILGASIYHRIHFFPRWIFAYQTNFPYSNSHKSWENHHFGPIAIGLEPFHPKYIIIRGYFILSPGPRGLARPPHIFKCRYRIYIYTYIYILDIIIVSQWYPNLPKTD